MWQVVRAKADAGAAVLLATHHMDEAEALADRIVVIADGRILADGPPAAIKAQVAGVTYSSALAGSGVELYTVAKLLGYVNIASKATLSTSRK